MNKFSDLQKTAAEEWYQLHTGDSPVVYVGMGSCGIASGAGEIYNFIKL